jgi:hypothetical protein
MERDGLAMAGMKRPLLRLLIAALLVGVTFVAVKLWTGKYDRDPDPRARYRIEAASLERDRSYMWLEIHLQKSGSKEHDMLKPVRLITANGTEYEAADTTFAGAPGKGFTDIWFKFWLEEAELEGKIDLSMNAGRLRVKTNEGAPATDKNGKAVFRSADWGKTWLGF